MILIFNVLDLYDQEVTDFFIVRDSLTLQQIHLGNDSTSFNVINLGFNNNISVCFLFFFQQSVFQNVKALQVFTSVNRDTYKYKAAMDTVTVGSLLSKIKYEQLNVCCVPLDVLTAITE